MRTRPIWPVKRGLAIVIRPKGGRTANIVRESPEILGNKPKIDVSPYPVETMVSFVWFSVAMVMGTKLMKSNARIIPMIIFLLILFSFLY
jgi:hypothetical protein